MFSMVTTSLLGSFVTLRQRTNLAVSDIIYGEQLFCEPVTADLSVLPLLADMLFIISLKESVLGAPSTASGGGEGSSST